jgi:S-adenosylmethionine synthetase
MRSDYLFTSESVSEGHPDKVADQISDAIVDLFLGKDPEARIACETLTTTNLVVLAGEIRGKGIMDEAGNWAPGVPEEVEAVVRETVKRIGYEQDGFHWATFRFENNLHPQSAHIAQGVDAGDNKDEGAGDQGIMFGFACDETPDLMPATLDYSHKILQQLATDRHSGAAPFLEPDAKSQVTLRFKDGRPVAATAIGSGRAPPLYSAKAGQGADEAQPMVTVQARPGAPVAALLRAARVTLRLLQGKPSVASAARTSAALAVVLMAAGAVALMPCQ